MSQAKATAQKKTGFDWTILVIPIAVVIGILVYMFVCGNPNNFADPDTKEKVISVDKDGLKHYLGLVYAGGFIVPLLIAMAIMVVTFSIERAITIAKASGTGSLEKFLQKTKTLLHTGDINAAIAECNKQKGAVANVVVEGLHKYQEMEKNTEFNLEQKVQHIQQEIEEATSLELPGLQQNLPILATIASVATLFALLGTVLGMIRAFSSLGESASGGDPNKLAVGISEALVNTALGIGTSAVSIMMYNYLTTQIDRLTYGIDEIGYSVAQTFATTKR